MAMTKEQFLEKWLDTHTELQSLENASKGYIRNSPGDKNISNQKEIPGKKLIEKKCAEERDELFREYVDDGIGVRKAEILEMDFDKLMAIRVKMMVQRIEQKTETVHSFADMVKMVKLEAHKVETVENPLPETIDLPETSTEEDDS